MLPDLRDEIEVEFCLIGRLLEESADLRRNARHTAPNKNETVVLASVLHSFYTGVENLLNRIITHVDGKSPQGRFWHRDVLLRMARCERQRPAIISEELRIILSDYLHFRHMFRHAYAFELKWTRMAPLVEGIEDTFARLQREVRLYSESNDETEHG